MSHVEYAILGAGAIGSILGAHLVRAGHTVAMLARGRRAQQIRTEGLRIAGLVNFSTPVQVIEHPSGLQSADVLIVATKAIDTAASLAPLRGARIGSAFSIQNGIMKNDLLADAFGRDRVLGALANISGELLPAGNVMFTRNVHVLIGDLAGGDIPPRVRSIANTLDKAGVRSTPVADIQSQEWSKFAGWVGLVGVAITARTNTWKFLLDASGARVMVRLVREVRTLAEACGVSLTDASMFPMATLSTAAEEAAIEIMQGYGRQFRDHSPQHRVSTLQDVEAGRPLEVEETLGFATRKAAALGLSLPLLEACYHLAGVIDRTRAGDSTPPITGSPGVS
jgi:2-dehydropantoate 2-reductase